MGRNSMDDDDDFKDELGPFFNSDHEEDDDGDDTPARISHAATMDMMQMDLVEMELNQRILKQAVKYCEKSFWWRFLGEKARQERIDRAYTRFRRLVKLDDPED